MRKLPGGWANGANCQEGANKATCQGGKVGKNVQGEALPLLPFAKVHPWMQPINCLVENLHTKPCFPRCVIFSEFFILEMYPKLNKL